jgi:gamma-glutamyltranspeptidase/glutathione hydrolase
MAWPFVCEKRPATASRGMVVANHPLASAAGSEMLLAGGNAVDAAVAALFALTVVEPMMVGLLGGGIAHLRLPDGRHVILDGLSTAPAAATPDMYATVSDTLPDYRETRDRRNAVGALSVAVPGALAGWCAALERFGTMPLADVVAPAIRLAEHGFVVTPYLSDCITGTAADLASDPALAALFLPGGTPLQAGDRLVQADYAQTLRIVARDGAEALYAGPLGDALAQALAARGGLIHQRDLTAYRVVDR